MSMNRNKIVKALFESYITMRAGVKWGQTEFAPEKISSKTKAHIKLDTCASVLNAIPYSDDYNSGWINFVYALADKEHVESLDAQNSRSTPSAYFPVGALFVNSETLLQQTMHAARSYIVQQLLSDPDSRDAVDREKKLLSAIQLSLTADLAIARKTPNADKGLIEKKEKELQSAVNKFAAIVEAESSKYHLEFFENHLKTEDKREGLNEVSFDDYVKNVLNKKRPYDKCDKLLGVKARAATATAAIVAAATPVAAAAKAPALPAATDVSLESVSSKPARSPLAANSTFSKPEANRYNTRHKAKVNADYDFFPTGGLTRH